MAAGDHGPETMRRYAAAQARLEHAGGYAWRENSLVGAARARVRGRTARPAALDVLGRRADARVAGAVARGRSRLAPARRADEPSRCRAAGVAGEDARRARRGGDPRRPRPLVPRGGDDRGARARGRPVDRTSPGSGTCGGARRRRARSTRRSRSTATTPTSRGSQRFVDRFRYKKSKAKQAQAKLTQIGRLKKEKAVAADELALLTRHWQRLGFEFLNPPRSGKTSSRSMSCRSARREAPARRRDAGDRPWRARRARRPERRREDHAARGPAGAAANGHPGSATASCRRTSRSTRPSSTSVARCSSASRR